jgi:O-antigen ligase
VHGSTSKGHFTFVVGVILIGAIAAVLNIGSVLGLSDKGMTVYHLGNNVYITRISPLGDPNITTIYFLGLAVSLPIWQSVLGKAKGFIVGTASFVFAFFAISGSASRGGSIAMVFSALVMYYCLWVKDKRSRMLILLLLSIVFLSLFIDIQNPVHPKEFNTLIERFNQLTLEGKNEVNAYTRLVSILWLIEDIFTGPRLVGIGFERFSQYTVSRGGLWLPHNSFVDLYVIGGIFGLIAFIMLWWIALRAQIKNIDVKDEKMRLYSIWFSSFGAGLIVLVFSVSIAWTKLIWAFLGMGVAISRINKANLARTKIMGL